MHPMFDVRLMESNDVEMAASCISRSFSEREPLCIALGISHEDMMTFCMPYFEHIQSQNLSYVAECQQSGNIIGARISEDPIISSFDAELLEHVNPKLLPILSILEYVSAEYYASEAPKEGSHVHMLMIGVHSAYLNKGVAQKMNQELFSAATVRGYRSIVTEPTGIISQHILEKSGFRAKAIIRYRDFEFEGGRPFLHLGSEQCVSFMTKRIFGQS